MTIDNSTTTRDIGTAPTIDELRARFAPVFERIAAGAVERETERILPFEQVGWLRDAGFGTLRIPQEFGGLGASLRQLFELLIDLGAADSNLPQLLRGHFAFLEGRLNVPDRESQRRWFDLAVDGALFGNAQAESGATTASTTELTASGDAFLLNGAKYYSTGTIFADWIWSTATIDDEHVGVALPAEADGVTRIDDWDGFGQRLTGSGTTRFEGVEIPAEQVIRLSADDTRAHSNITSFYQLVLLAALAGIGRRALSDTVEFVRKRTRTFGVPGESSPRTDPLVQRVVGRISSLSEAARVLVLARADDLDAVHELWRDGAATAEDYDRAEIAVFQAQQVVIRLVLDLTADAFEVGGASATSRTLAFDRHWRNARTIASHNPAIYRERAIGDYELNGAVPAAAWPRKKDADEKDADEKADTPD
jgi:alkylation response protein AidB-like acyl-CoA dehydrogenase